MSVEFLIPHKHTLKILCNLNIFTASIIWVSAMEPTTYVVTARDLTTATAGNSLCKFADDTYLIIPASNEALCQAKLVNIQAWAERNRRLNCSKSRKVIFSDTLRRWRVAELPGITR